MYPSQAQNLHKGSRNYCIGLHYILCVCVCAVSGLTPRDKERAGETTQTVSSWFILASQVGQFINLLHSDARINPHTGQPTRIPPASSVWPCMCGFLYVLLFPYICVCLHSPLCKYLSVYWVFCLFMLCMYYIYMCLSAFVCLHQYVCFHVCVSLSACFCACLCVAFEMCRGGCLSL